MIINDKEALNRLHSPMNLLNQLNSLKSNNRKNAMSLFVGAATPIKQEVKLTFNPFSESKVEEYKEPVPSTHHEITPTLDNLIENSTEQVRLSLAHDAALGVLNSAVALLQTKLDDVKADKLPSVITATSKVVESIRRERLESSKTKDREVHYHFYTPEQKKISDYEVIDIT